MAAYNYTGRNTTLYYSSPAEIVAKGNFMVEDIRSDWTNGQNESDFDDYLIECLKIVKDIIDLDRNINFSNDAAVPGTVHLIATFIGYFLIKDGSDTQDSYIKNNEEVRIYARSKMFDDNVKNLLALIPKRSIAGKFQDQIRIRAVRSNIDAVNPYDIIRWR